MVLEDPRLVIRQLFDPSEAEYAVTPSNLLEEDGVTQAKHEANYEYSELMIERLMLENPFHLDIIFIITLIGENPPDGGASGAVCYNHVLGIQPVTIDKFNIDGSVKIDGTELSYAAIQEIKKVIRENPYGSIRRVRGRLENVTRVGLNLIYGDVVEVEYKQYASPY